MSPRTSTNGRATESLGSAAKEKRRLLLLVRTGLTLAIGYLLIFSAVSTPPLVVMGFVLGYLATNIVIAALPLRVLGRAEFDIALILADTAAISCALVLLPDANTDVFVFYFAIILLASITDRVMLSVLAPLFTSIAYLAFLLARHGVSEVLQPAMLLRLPFFLLTGLFYAFFVDRARRSQVAAAVARQRVQARTELLSMITHDLKQPLWVASQSAAMLYDQIEPERTADRELAGQVSVSLKRMTSLIQNFLDLDRMDARALRAVPQRTSLNRVVEDLLDSYRPSFDVRGIRLDVALASDLPPAWIDPLQLERCLGNLLDNALKFTPAGGTVTCRTTAAGQSLLLTLGDSGPGISPERQASLFERFQDGTDAGGRRSTGLGLHIAHALAKSLGGAIELDVARTDGAWFHVRLPIATPEGATTQHSPAIASSARPHASRPLQSGYPLLQNP